MLYVCADQYLIICQRSFTFQNCAGLRVCSLIFDGTSFRRTHLTLLPVRTTAFHRCEPAPRILCSKRPRVRCFGVQVLTLYGSKQTTGRRSPPVPQLLCRGEELFPPTVPLACATLCTGPMARAPQHTYRGMRRILPTVNVLFA